jgi:hypothetical protein
MMRFNLENAFILYRVNGYRLVFDYGNINPVWILRQLCQI